jgi:hypothetical protein
MFYLPSPWYLRIPQIEMLVNLRHGVKGRPRPVLWVGGTVKEGEEGEAEKEEFGRLIFCVDEEAEDVTRARARPDPNLTAGAESDIGGNESTIEIETRGRTKQKPQLRTFAEILHSGKGTYYIFDYINDELFRFSTQYIQTYPQLLEVLQLTAQYSATDPSAPDWLRDVLEPVEAEEEGVRLIERIMQRDESVIDEVESRIGWRPRPTGLVEEMRTPIGGVDPNVLRALGEEAKRRGVDLEEVLWREREKLGLGPRSDSGTRRGSGRAFTPTGETMFPSPDAVHAAKEKVKAKTEAKAFVDRTHKMADDAIASFEESVRARVASGDLTEEQAEKFLKEMMSDDPRDTNRALQGLMEDFLGEFSEENKEQLKKLSEGNVSEEEKEKVMRSVMEDHVANSARFSSSLMDENRGPHRMQDFREELSRKMAEVDELPEEEQLARLEQIGEEMRNEAKELDRQFEGLKKRVEEARSGSVEGGAGARGLDQLTELMAGLGMGGGAVPRSPKDAEATSAHLAEGKTTAQESERASSSIPSIKELERMMKEMDDTEITQPKQTMQGHGNASENLDKDFAGKSPLLNDPDSVRRRARQLLDHSAFLSEETPADEGAHALSSPSRSPSKPSPATLFASESTSAPFADEAAKLEREPQVVKPPRPVIGAFRRPGHLPGLAVGEDSDQKDTDASENDNQSADSVPTVGSFRRVQALSRRELREVEEKKNKLEEERKAIPPRKVVGAFRNEANLSNENDGSEKEDALRGIGPFKRIPGMSRKERKEATDAAEKMLVDEMVKMELRKYMEKMAETARSRRTGEDPGLEKGVGAFSRFKEGGVGRRERRGKEHINEAEVLKETTG